MNPLERDRQLEASLLRAAELVNTGGRIGFYDITNELLERLDGQELQVLSIPQMLAHAAVNAGATAAWNILITQALGAAELPGDVMAELIAQLSEGLAAIARSYRTLVATDERYAESRGQG